MIIYNFNNGTTLLQHFNALEKANLEHQPIDVEKYQKISKVKAILEAGLSEYPLQDFYDNCGNMNDEAMTDYILTHVEHLKSIAHDYFILTDSTKPREDNASDHFTAYGF